uniref:MAGE domain-containing protein n=1 Tax=Romanomermis culicivorax TaxID=13658 RepID=A0A915JPS8_ROMCU
MDKRQSIKRHADVQVMERPKRKLSNSNNSQAVDENEDQSPQRDHHSATSNALTEKINDMVRYLLTTKQKDCPILKSDLIKHCLNSDRSNFDSVFEKAVEKLKGVFGIDAKKINAAGKISYVLVNDLKTPDQIDNFPPYASADPTRVRFDLALLYPALMFIRLRHPETKICPEKVLLDFLKTLSYNLEKNLIRPHVHNNNNDSHEKYGAETLKKLLYKDWVQKNYLKIIKTTAPDGITTSEIGWGEKAVAEVHLDNAFGGYY